MFYYHQDEDFVEAEERICTHCSVGGCNCDEEIDYAAGCED